jgi:hypothetical protein
MNFACMAISGRTNVFLANHFSRANRSLLGGLIFLLVACIPEVSLLAQAPAANPAAGDASATSHPCSMAQSSPAHKKKSKNKLREEKQVVSACLEAKASPLDIQEFFQNYLRVQGWRFGEERIVADGWMFARYLDKDELLQFAKEGILAGRVKWTEGKALVQVTTREIDGGFTRVEVSARMQGNGQNVDRFAPPKDTWDLDSSGVLEKNLIDALDVHFKSLH